MIPTSPAGPLGIPFRAPAAILAGGSGTRAAALKGDGTVAGGIAPGESLVGILPPVFPEWLGDRSFAAAHGARFPYVVGEMARGIASPEMVIEAARAGMMAFLGSAGLPIAEVDAGIGKIRSALGPEVRNWGANLIHSPQEPAMEMAFAELVLARGVTNISASAFMQLAPAVVFLAAKGLRLSPDGTIHRHTRIFAKISRVEVARPFLAPAPEALLAPLVAEGRITPEEAALARQIPVATDVTVEADSGGHTDNRPLSVLLPRILQLADAEAPADPALRPRIGVGGGLGSPGALAAAFAAGAAYVVTGSVNQASREAAISDEAKRMLADASMTDVAMAPAADMFELGVEVQVLKRGTLFAQRGKELYRIFRTWDSFEAMPRPEFEAMERRILGRPVADIWAETRAFFAERDPSEVARAEADPKHLMALVFRWYLFMGAQWARTGDPARRTDYQIWCGPAMGAFNDWVRGSFLEPVENRSVVQIGLNLLEGAAWATRAHQLTLAGVPLSPADRTFHPRPLRL